MIRKLGTIAVFSFGFLMLGNTARAEEPFNYNDRFQKAAVTGMTETELGKLAQSNGAGQDIKDFGKRMVDDHKKIHDNLEIVAKNAGIKLPTALPDKEKTLVE